VAWRGDVVCRRAIIHSLQATNQTVRIKSKVLHATAGSWTALQDAFILPSAIRSVSAPSVLSFARRRPVLLAIRSSGR
jgi:hypothetical protein